MSIITRAVKNGSGTPNYVADTLIEADEVNLDFNTMYDDYDGNITNANIAGNANIDGAKLADLTIPPDKFVALGTGSANAIANLVNESSALIASVPITGLGGPILLVPAFYAHLILLGGGPLTTVTWTIGRGGTLATIISTAASDDGTTIPLAPPLWLDLTAAAASYTYTYTLTISSNFFSTSPTPGTLFAKELIR